MLPVTYIEMPPFKVFEKVRNPFRSHVMHGQFDACVRCFDVKHKDLIRADNRNGNLYQHRGNAWATHFWWGFNGIHNADHYKGSKNTPAYACWVAGRRVRDAIRLAE